MSIFVKILAMELKITDPMGAAIYDYYKTGKADTLVVRSSMFEDDEIPVPSLFREYELEQELYFRARFCY